MCIMAQTKKPSDQLRKEVLMHMFEVKMEQIIYEQLYVWIKENTIFQHKRRIPSVKHGGGMVRVCIWSSTACHH